MPRQDIHYPVLLAAFNSLMPHYMSVMYSLQQDIDPVFLRHGLSQNWGAGLAAFFFTSVAVVFIGKLIKEEYSALLLYLTLVCIFNLKLK